MWIVALLVILTAAPCHSDSAIINGNQYSIPFGGDKATVYLSPVESFPRFSSDIQHDERTYEDKEAKRFYIIGFTYNTEYCSVPAVRGARPHYEADITVYEIVNGEKIKIASFRGVYVPGGCFEDDSAYLVKKANELNQKR